MSTKPLTPDPNDPRYVTGWNDPKSPNYNPTLKPLDASRDPANPAIRAIHPAYGAHRIPEAPLSSTPAHAPHECCGRIFQTKADFEAHFAAIHTPFVTDAVTGKQIPNAGYVEPGKDVASVHHVGLPHAEHRAGPFNEQGHSTGLAATEKRIPVPHSGVPPSSIIDPVEEEAWLKANPTKTRHDYAAKVQADYAAQSATADQPAKEWGKPPAADKPAAKGWDTKSK